MALARWERTIVDGAGNVQSGASVEVRAEADNSLVSLYSDRDGVTPIGNPFTADSNGKAAFHVVGGAYKITATSGSFSDTWRYVAVGTAAEIDSDDLALSISVRDKLTTNRTYYVRTDGNDSNDGTDDSADGAFLTIQKAFDVVYGSLDLAGFSVTIRVKGGTYTAGVSQASPQVGAGTITVVGDDSSGTTLVSVTSSNCFYIRNYARVRLQNIEMRTTSSGRCIFAETGGLVTIGTGVRFGAAVTAHITANLHGIVNNDAGYEVTGSCALHWEAVSGGLINIQFVTITISGTPAFTQWLRADTGGIYTGSSLTFSGSATGARFLVRKEAAAFINGMTLPGDSAGSVSDGGYVDTPITDNSHCRFWLRATANSTTIQQSFNVTSVADTATGQMTVTIATDFAAATWAPQITLEAAQADGAILVSNADNSGIAAGTLLMESWLVGTTTEALTDPTSWSACGFGAQ